MEIAALWASIGVIVLGALGVYFTQRKDAQSSLQIANANATAADANARAAEAAKVAAQANERAALANAQAADAHKVAAATDERAKALEVEAAQQQERAARAEAELLTLRNTITPRHLSADARRQLIEALTSTPGPRGPTQINCVVGDAECGDFAREFLASFTSAGWPVEGPGTIGEMSGMTSFGMTVIVRSWAAPPPHAVGLLRALKSVGGLDITNVSHSILRADLVVFFVGSKPPIR